jgi:hypothetical protein
MPLSSILRRLAIRKAQYCLRCVTHALNLHSARLSAGAATAILKFRAVGRQAAPAGTPEAVLPIIRGDMARVWIDETFPRTSCYVQVDPEAFAIRWSREHFTSLHTVEGGRMTGSRSSQRKSRRRSSHTSRFSLPPAAHCSIEYNGPGGVTRVLELRLFNHNASAWEEALTALLNMVPRSASPAS